MSQNTPFSRNRQITVPSSEPVIRGLERAISAISEPEESKFVGRKVNKMIFMNAIAHWLGSLSESEVQEFMTPKLKEFEEYVKQTMKDDPGDPKRSF
jgi:hypothetical protein